MRSAAVYVIGLVVAIGVLEAIKATPYRRYAWLYVAILLMGVAVYNRDGLMSFSAYIQGKLKGG